MKLRKSYFLRDSSCLVLTARHNERSPECKSCALRCRTAVIRHLMWSNNSVRLLPVFHATSPPHSFILAFCLCFLNGSLVWKMRGDTTGLFRPIFTLPTRDPCLIVLWCKDTRQLLFLCYDSRALLNSVWINADLDSEEPHLGWMSVRAAAWQDEVCSFPYLLTRSLFSECLKLITASRNQTEGWKSALSLQWNHSSS